MVRAKNKIYEVEDADAIDNMVEIAQTTLKELGNAIKTHYLDKTLVEISGVDGTNKSNTVTLYYENNKVYVRIKAQSLDPEEFFAKFEENRALYGTSTGDLEKKVKIVSKIMDAIKEMGYSAVEDDIWDFLLNFEKAKKRLPNDEEIKSIALSYVKFLKESGASSEEHIFVGEEEEEEEEISPEDITAALKEIIKEMPTLTEEDKEFIISLFDDLTVEEQKKLVTKIQEIEKDLDKVPYLLMDERSRLRREVLGLSTQKRRQKLLKVISKRKKNLQYYQNRALEGKIREMLEKIPFLTDLERDILMARMQNMSIDEKKRYIKRLKRSDEYIATIKASGVHLSEIEEKAIREELLRLDEASIKKRIEEIIEEKKYEETKEQLFEAVPALRFEDSEKIIRELMWLDPEERKRKIEKYKKQFLEKTVEKTKAFEESKVGSTCPKCGWPVGRFTKKCPRCGAHIGFYI